MEPTYCQDDVVQYHESQDHIHSEDIYAFQVEGNY
jgi:hypothetical protein